MGKICRISCVLLIKDKMLYNSIHTLVGKSKVTKILMYNSEFFQVLPVSFEIPTSTSTQLQNLTACCHYLDIGTVSTESR